MTGTATAGSIAGCGRLGERECLGFRVRSYSVTVLFASCLSPLLDAGPGRGDTAVWLLIGNLAAMVGSTTIKDAGNSSEAFVTMLVCSMVVRVVVYHGLQ